MSCIYKNVLLNSELFHHEMYYFESFMSNNSTSFVGFQPKVYRFVSQHRSTDIAINDVLNVVTPKHGHMYSSLWYNHMGSYDSASCRNKTYIDDAQGVSTWKACRYIKIFVSIYTAYIYIIYCIYLFFRYLNRYVCMFLTCISICTHYMFFIFLGSHAYRNM